MPLLDFLYHQHVAEVLYKCFKWQGLISKPLKIYIAFDPEILLLDAY